MHGRCRVPRRRPCKSLKAIDALVYQLYGLTEEEVRVVEGK
jgi:hypothetical protein